MIRNKTVKARVTVSMPFPLKDLTSITEATHTVDPEKRYERTWKLISGDYHRNEGSWILMPFNKDSNKTLVYYEVQADPKIRIPRKIQQLAQKKAISSLVAHLRQFALSHGSFQND